MSLTPFAGRGHSSAAIRVPNGFAAPAVKGDAAPASLWKGQHYGDNVTLTVTPMSAVVDQPVAICVAGLEAGAPVTVTADTTDWHGNVWCSHSTFVADGQGHVDLATAAPIYGSYAGAHAMGLIWSMRPQGVKNPSSLLFVPAEAPYAVRLQACAGARVLAQATLARRYVAPDVGTSVVTDDGLVGNFYMPTTPDSHAAVIVLGGSGGGLHPQVEEAAILASHGYAALGLAYFQGDRGQGNPRLAGLPERLTDIKLEYFLKAAQWLRRQRGVDASRVGIIGASKGAEAALITAATYPQAFQAVVATMPTSVVWSGITRRGPRTSSWSVDGKPLAWVNTTMTASTLAAFITRKPAALRPVYAAGLKNMAAVRSATIPVTRIAGPILLISAEDDQMWPSATMARQIMQRLATDHHAYADQSLCYAQAGHLVAFPHRPTNTTSIKAGRFAMRLGGNPVAGAFANQDSWPEILAFLDSALR